MAHDIVFLKAVSSARPTIPLLIYYPVINNFVFKVASMESVLRTNRRHTVQDQNIIFIPDKANSGECVLYRQAMGPLMRPVSPARHR